MAGWSRRSSSSTSISLKGRASVGLVAGTGSEPTVVLLTLGNPCNSGKALDNSASLQNSSRPKRCCYPGLLLSTSSQGPHACLLRDFLKTCLHLFVHLLVFQDSLTV